MATNSMHLPFHTQNQFIPSTMHITLPNPKLDQPLTNLADPKSPAPTRTAADDGSCVFSIIDKEKLTSFFSGDANRPPSHLAAGFYLRWTIIVFNISLELAQIILAVEASGGKLKPPTYRALTAATSSICFVLSLIEVAHGFRKRNDVVLRRKANRVGFGTWFGLVSSAVQFSVNVTALAVKKTVVNVDYLGFMFSVCYFFAAINGGRSSHVAVVKCVSHGSCEAEGKFVDGIWVFQCSKCTSDQIKLA